MAKDLTGLKFNRLTVIKLHHKGEPIICKGKSSGCHYFWLCECECGNKIIVDGIALTTAHTKSCGCYKSEKLKQIKTKHGLYCTRLHNIWNNLKQRCLNSKRKDYKSYGGRGITVCNEWLEFKNFYDWSMANGYTDELSIDRIDNNGNYEPSNCRWVTKETQNKNRRNNHKVTYNGITKCVCDWAKDIGIDEAALRYRLKAWGIEKALNTPKQQ